MKKGVLFVLLAGAGALGYWLFSTFDPLDLFSITFILASLYSIAWFVNRVVSRGRAHG